MQRYAPLAVNTLAQVMMEDGAPTSSKVAAATAIMRFGREGIELDDLAARVEALEQAAPQRRTSDGRPLGVQDHLGIEVLLDIRLGVKSLGDQGLDVGRVEAGELDVEVRDPGQLIQQLGQLVLVPVAADLVEGDVEGLLTVVGQERHLLFLRGS